MVFLAYCYNTFSPENIFCAVNAVIGGKPCVVKENILRLYALLQSKGTHNVYFVIVRSAVVAAHNYFFRRAAFIKLNACKQSVAQHRFRLAVLHARAQN